MTCECSSTSAKNESDIKTLKIALALNAMMFIVGMSAGLWAQSTSLMADALDMLADALSYGIASASVTRGVSFKRISARWSGTILLVLGIGIVVEVIRRGMSGSEPHGIVMMVFSLASLAVNVTVLKMLGKFKSGEVHLRATWIFTRVDVIANIAVLISGGLVALTGLRFIDLAVGALIGCYVVKEAIEILRETQVKVSK